MIALLFVHIFGGTLALTGGYAALFAHKGGRLHRKAGTLFVYAMLAMGAGAFLLGMVRGKEATALGGPLVAYLVLTAVTTMRPPTVRSRKLDSGLMVLGLAVGTVFMAIGIQTLGSPSGKTDGVPAPPILMNGVVALLGFVGDVRVRRGGAPRGGARLVRHLWRMCYALFTASGSFFLGQAQVIPEPLRIPRLLLALAVLPLLAMPYWLWRVRRRQDRPLVPETLRTPVALSFALLVPAALAIAPRARAQSIAQAESLFRQGRYADARVQLVALQASDGGDAAAAYFLGRMAAAEEDDEEAIRQLERAVRLNEGNALYHYWLGRALYDASPRASKVRVPFMARRVRRAWERAIALDPAQLDARAGLADYYAMAPGFMGGSKVKAREQAAELAKRDAMRGVLARGVIARREADARAELTAYEQAIRLAPDTTAGYIALAHAYARAGTAGDAFDALDRYAKRRPDDHWIFFHVGQVAATTGQGLERGEAAFHAFLATPPNGVAPPVLARAHYGLGRIAEKRGRSGTAREHYQSALRTNPNSHAARRALDALR